MDKALTSELFYAIMPVKIKNNNRYRSGQKQKRNGKGKNQNIDGIQLEPR